MTGAAWLQLTLLDVRVLRATDAYRERTAERVARMAGCSEEEARRSLKRLRGKMMIEPDGRRPTGWLRTRRGDLALEHAP
jgi:hypothetical protein